MVRVQVLWRGEFNQARFIYVRFNRDRLLFKTNANSTLLPYTATTLLLLDASKHSTKSRFVQQNHVFVQQENVTVLKVSKGQCAIVLALLACGNDAPRVAVLAVPGFWRREPMRAASHERCLERSRGQQYRHLKAVVVARRAWVVALIRCMPF